MCNRGDQGRLRGRVRRCRRNARAFVVALALLFAGAQAYVLMHGATYGADVHEHDGTACHVAAMVKGLTGLLPVAYAGSTAPAFGTAGRPVCRCEQVQTADLRERKPIRAPPFALS